MQYRQLARSALKDLRLHVSIRELLLSVLIVALSSGLAVWTEPYTGLVTAALIFVLGVTVTGALYGLAAALVAAFVAFLIYNFFLSEPFLSFRMAESRDVAPLIAFNLSALIAGVLAGRLQDRAQAAHRSNLQLASLLEASQELQSAVRPAEIVGKLENTAPARLGLDLGVFRYDGTGLVEIRSLHDDAAGSPRRRLAELTWTKQRPSHSDDDGTGFLLHGGSGPIGVLVVGSDNRNATALAPAFLAALANLIALALERAELSENVAEAKALARSEELKTALLSSVSHDFRTPLTAISASASSLIEYSEQLPAGTRIKLLRSIVDECDRLNRYTANLLELSKLQAGTPIENTQVLDVVDILGSAIQRIRPRLEARTIERHIPEGGVLVRADAALFELVLVNVFENAITYSEDGTCIEVTACEDDSEVAIDIRDEGFGIPAADLGRVFDRFYRVRRSEAKPRGSGLGLAIAKGFVEAFEGRIWAETPGIDGRGTHIAIRLPAVVRRER